MSKTSRNVTPETTNATLPSSTPYYGGGGPIHVHCEHLTAARALIESRDAEIGRLREAIRRAAIEIGNVCDGGKFCTCRPTIAGTFPHPDPDCIVYRFRKPARAVLTREEADDE